MSIVRPPFIIDFGKSKVDEKPDFPAEIWEQWYGKLAEDFEDRWPEAHAVFCELRDKWGIYHMDLSTNNLRFARPKDD